MSWREKEQNRGKQMDRRRGALTRLALNHSELAGGGKEWGKITMRKKVKITSLPARQTKRLSVCVNVEM